MRGPSLLLAAAAALILAAPSAAQLGGSSGTTMSFAMTLRVPADRWEASLEETRMLWE